MCVPLVVVCPPSHNQYIHFTTRLAGETIYPPSAADTSPSPLDTKTDREKYVTGRVATQKGHEGVVFRAGAKVKS